MTQDVTDSEYANRRSTVYTYDCTTLRPLTSKGRSGEHFILESILFTHTNPHHMILDSVLDRVNRPCRPASRRARGPANDDTNVS